MFAGFWTRGEEMDLEDELFLCDCEDCTWLREDEYAFDFEVAMASEFEFELYWLDHGVEPTDVYAADSVDVGVYDTAPWAVGMSVFAEADSWSVQV